MNDNIENYEHNGLTVSIWYDEDQEDPLSWSSPQERGGVWFALKRRYTDRLPHEIDADTEDYNSWTELADAVTGKDGELEGKAYKFVRWYEHSGIVLSLRDTEDGASFDAGIAGVVFYDDEAAMRSEFQAYACYMEGAVYGYSITNPKNGDTVDSCGGFYGYSSVHDEANRVADAFKHPHDAAYAAAAKELHR